MSLNTPVVFLIFNRPDVTQRVFKEISKVKPKKLLVVADGPRLDREDDQEKCQATRSIIEQVDWHCEVLKNYADDNLGCQKRVSSGLNWVFDQVEEAIILEDDCFPTPTLFPFCEELLAKYRADERIAVISGQNVQFNRNKSNYSYYFSLYNHCWGWATWKRAWQNFDYEMKHWPLVRDNGWLKNILVQPNFVEYWTRIFQGTYEQKINSWAYRWTFSCWMQNQLSILANNNLISNIGFGNQGTNTKKSQSVFANMATQDLVFPLAHPPVMIRNIQADNFTQKTLYKTSLINRIKLKIKKIGFRR